MQVPVGYIALQCRVLPLSSTEMMRMESLHDRMRQTGEDTTSAIEAGNREAAKSRLLLIAAIAGLASALKNQ